MLPREYLNLWGLVPRGKYEAVLQENAELRAKVTELEDTLPWLRTLTAEKGLGLEAAVLEFQKPIHKQGD